MATARVPSNLRAAGQALARLSKQDRLEEFGELLGVLLRSSARLVDQAIGPESDCAGYARARIIATHAALIAQFAELVGGAAAGDAFEAFMAQLALPRMTGTSDEPGRWD
jgi:hypothetical protein